MNIETILDHQTILENRRPDAFFAVRFKAPDPPAPNTEPAAYCLLLDQSASVGDRAFELARRFATQFVRHLPANCLFSLVTFHETAEALIDLGPLTDKSALQAIIGEIQPVDYGTNLSAGVLLAREQLVHAPDFTVRKKIILLTDGEHTAGIRDETLLAQITAESDISIVQLGSANSALLQSLSTSFHPKLSGENLLPIIETELGALQPLAAQNIRLRLKLLEFCEKIEPLGLRCSEFSDGWFTFQIGDMLAGEERTLCFNVTVALLPWIDDEPCASLANEALLEIEAGYQEITASSAAPKSFATTVRIPTLANTIYPPSQDGSMPLRDGA
jgi:hypothetical protein